ncbi:MAG: PD-(D/E)XK nuclease family protein, partial [Verrucomicrobiota bacterium]
FARFGLRLRPRRERLVGHTDLSQLYHEVLQRLVGELIQSRQSWSDLSESEGKRRLARLTEQLGRQLRDELMLSTARNRYLLAHVEKTLALVAAAQSAAASRGNFRPALVNLRYGPGEKIAGVTIQTPAGHQAILTGKIDRVDLLPDGSAAIIDYRLKPQSLNPTEAYHGLSLQLLTYLLVVEKTGSHLLKTGKLTPAGAFCVQLLRKIERDDPLDALDPSDPRFHLRRKPRGLFNGSIVSDLDSSLVEGTSEVIEHFIKKDGTPGARSDAASAEQFEAILRHVERRIGELADEIMAGRIDIRPYRLGKDTPCSRCEFRSLCRLEPSPGCYDDLEPLNREQLLDRAMQGREK